MQQTSLTRALARWVGVAVLAALFSALRGAQADDNSLTSSRATPAAVRDRSLTRAVRLTACPRNISL